MTEIIRQLKDVVFSEVEVGPEQSAKWLFKILTETYGRHNLSSSEEQICAEIKSGRLKPFFVVDKNKPLSCAALIFSEDRIEVGRAANAKGGRDGSRALQAAVKFWEKLDDPRPVVAEIRMAAPFEGIAGGQGSQAVLLGKEAMTPHAFLPAFHHPGPNGPDRQEIFCFAYREKQQSSRIGPHEIFLPEHPLINLELLSLLLMINGFNIQISTVPLQEGEVRVRKKFSVPFNFFELTEEGVNLDQFPQNRKEENPFDLIAVEILRDDLPDITSVLVTQGFILSGITPPFEEQPRFLFGRLRKCILAPTEPMRNFPAIDPTLILQVNHQYYEQSQR